MHARHLAAALLAAAVPFCAHAQSVPDTSSTKSVLDDTYVTVGVGAIYAPSYEGSNNSTVSAVPLVMGKVEGIGINPRPNGVGLDLIPDGKDAKVGFILGPVASYSRNRAHNIQDKVVIASGRLKSAIDVGVTGGVVAYKLLSDYDSLTLSADVKWNVNSAYKGMVILPTLTYTTPLSRAILVSLSATAKRVDKDYAHYYYDVSALQSARSGLPLYTARGGGWATVGGTLLAAYDLDGNLLNGGFSLVGLASYNKLINDAKRTPYTSLRGSDNQWTVGGGIAYTF